MSPGLGIDGVRKSKVQLANPGLFKTRSTELTKSCPGCTSIRPLF